MSAKVSFHASINYGCILDNNIWTLQHSFFKTTNLHFIFISFQSLSEFEHSSKNSASLFHSHIINILYISSCCVNILIPSYKHYGNTDVTAWTKTPLPSMFVPLTTLHTMKLSDPRQKVRNNGMYALWFMKSILLKHMSRVMTKPT
jgi:hypothetical protein